MSNQNLIRNARRRELWGLVGKLGQTLTNPQGLPIGKDAAESLMRDRLYATFGVASTKAITPQQMGDLSQQLRDLLDDHSQDGSLRGAERRSNLEPGCHAAARNDRRDGAAVISPKQQTALVKMATDLGMDAQSYRALCQRILHRPWPQTRDEGATIYQTLNALELARRDDRITPRAKIDYCLDRISRLDAYKQRLVLDLNRKLQHGNRLTARMLAKLDEAYAWAGGGDD